MPPGLHCALDVPLPEVIDAGGAIEKLGVRRNRVGRAGDPASRKADRQAAQLIVGTRQEPITQAVSRSVREPGDRLPNRRVAGCPARTGEHVQAAAPGMTHVRSDN